MKNIVLSMVVKEKGSKEDLWFFGDGFGVRKFKLGLVVIVVFFGVRFG